MKKKRPLGVTVAGIADLLLAATLIYLIFTMGMQSKAPEDLFVNVIMGVFSAGLILIGISVLKLKPGAREGNIAVSLLSALMFFGCFLFNHSDTDPMGSAFYAVLFLFFVVAAFYFTRPQVKELFRVR